MHVLTGSYLSNLSYCEYKAVLSLSRPLHRAKSPSRAVLRRVLARIRDVDARIEVLYGELGGVPVAVSPGAVLYRDGAPYGVLRPIIRGSLRVYEADFTVLRVAGALLEASGRAGEDLKLAVVVSTNESLLEEAIVMGIRSGLKPARTGGWILSTRIYDAAESRRILTRAVEVASNPALAKPSPSPRKCAVCEFSRQCPHAVR